MAETQAPFLLPALILFFLSVTISSSHPAPALRNTPIISSALFSPLGLAVFALILPQTGVSVFLEMGSHNFSISCAEDRALKRWDATDGGGNGGFVTFRRYLAQGAPSSSLVVKNSSFVLAAERTYRKDPLDSFNKYTGGWNISNRHYWASVGFTAAPLFVIAAAWFLLFALSLSILCCRYCCCPRRNYSYSHTAYVLSLILLLLFTCASIIGSIVLYTGQGKFHSSTTTTLDYVVGQANVTVDNMRDFSDKLSAAKKVGVDQVFLPSDVMSKIDGVVTKVDSAANNLDHRASDNSKNIHDVLDSVRLILIVLAAVMLLLALVGFLFSILGLKFLVYIVAGDTCVSMQDWVDNPQQHTALDDILPCVDVATANESLYQGRQVTFQLVNVVNSVVVNISNRNFPPGSFPLYYNQSGPLMPKLCNPYNPDLSNRTCALGEVNFNNATEAWQSYVCNVTVVSGNDVCTTVGRVTPKIYSQMKAAVSVSYGLDRYGLFLAQLEDCTFVRQTFSTISSNYCTGLGRYSKLIYIGLAMVSTAVMLSSVFWIVYAKERKHRRYRNRNQFLVSEKSAAG